MNVLEFRQRSFQFERIVEARAGPYAIFSRTETESERQLRPKLVRLTVLVPLPWLVYDDSADALRITTKGAPRTPTEASAVEIAAEPSEFEEAGERWKRAALGAAGYVYAPAERSAELLSVDALAGLRLG